MKKYIIFSFLISLLILCLFRCTNVNRRKYKEITRDEFIIKGYVINDSIFDDTISYYNKEDILIRQEVYKNGVLNGIFKEFYNNGMPRVKTSYFNGIKNGTNQYYDSLGRPIYVDYYYYGVPLGPIVWYDLNGIAKRFFFVSFDNKTLLDIDYTEWSGISDFVLKLINCNAEFQREDSSEMLSLFLYIIQPPKISIKYQLYKKNKGENGEKVLVANLVSEKPFIDYSIPVLKEDSCYLIQLTVYDSILNKQSIVQKEL